LLHRSHAHGQSFGQITWFSWGRVQEPSPQQEAGEAVWGQSAAQVPQLSVPLHIRSPHDGAQSIAQLPAVSGAWQRVSPQYAG
jgi:hypothetical protein